MVIEPRPALCKLLEYDGAEAVCFVNTGTHVLPRVGFPAAALRAEYLEPGMEFVWFVTDPRPEPPPKISRDPSILALARSRIDLLEMQDEEDREEAKFRAVPDEVVQKGVAIYKAFVLAAPNGAPVMDEKYTKVFGDLVAMLEPYDLLRKYRDVLLDRMISQGRQAGWEEWKRREADRKKFAGRFEVKCDPPVVIGEPTLTEKWAAMGRWGRFKARVQIAWRALFHEAPVVDADRQRALEAACRYTLAQEFDDICWLDFYTKIAKILGVEYDPKLLPRDRFLGNCGRFYDSMASGRPYERDPGKECCDASDGTGEGCGGGQPGGPVPVRDRAQAGG